MTTKLPLVFQTDINSEGDNSAWQVDKITAFVEGVEAGYLKISYIPKARFYAHFPSLFNWMDHRGKLIFPRDQQQTPWQSLAYADKQSLFKALRQYMFPFGGPEMPDSEDGLNTELARLEKSYAAGEVGEQYRSFKAFHLDKPMVDYIRVHDGTYEDHPTNFQRQGIGLALYQQGALYAHARGFSLWASGIQSEDAKRVWKKMTAMGWTRKVGDRCHLLNPTHLSLAA